MSNTNKIFENVPFRLLVIGITMVIIMSRHFNSFSQSAEDSITSKSFRSFRIKTDGVKWISLYPNIGIKYKFSKRFASNISISYIPTGVLWSAFKGSRNEKIPLKGFELNSGLKYYFNSRQFISAQLIYGNQKYNNHEFAKKMVSMLRNEYGFGLIYGIENKENKRFFNELNLGFGWKYSLIQKTTKNYNSNWSNYTAETSNYSENAPIIFLGWSFGSRTNPQTNEPILKNLYNKSLYVELLGNGLFVSINFEFTMYNINQFYLTGRLGLSAFTVPMESGAVIIPFFLINSQYQFSNRCFIEIGAGPRYFGLTSNGDSGYDFTSQVNLRYLAPKGFLFRIGITHSFLTKNSYYSLEGLIPGISIGKSF